MRKTCLLEDYLACMIGGKIRLSTVFDKCERSGWMTEFEFYRRGEVLGQEYLFCEGYFDRRYAPSKVAKTLAQVRKEVGCPIVFVPGRMEPHDYDRLLAHGVSFVCIFKTINLPEIGRVLDPRVPPPIMRDTFSPATQLLVIYYMIGMFKGDLTIEECARKIEYSPASVVTAFHEIEHFNIGERVRLDDGRSCVLKMISPKEIWRKHRHRFINPCKRVIGTVSFPPFSAVAGVDALYNFSNFPETKKPTHHAILLRHYRSLIRNECPRQIANYTVELWHYRPFTQSSKFRVDPISLVLTLENSRDARVQMAVEKILKDLGLA